MKKIFNKLSIFAATACLAFSSCESLDLVPEDSFTEGNFWKNEAQVNGFMVGLHNQLRGNYWNLYWLGEGRSYTQVIGSGSQATSTNNNTIISSALTRPSPGFNNWVGFYGPILQLNLFISRVEPMTEDILPKAKKDVFLAQAHSLRAFYYFQLLKTYGGVPIVTEPEVISATEPTVLRRVRSTEAQTMDQIKADLTKADALYANDAYTLTTGRNKWSKAATKTLIGEVYLWSAKVGKTPGNYTAADLTTALNALTDLQGSAKYSLMDKFADVFDYSNKGNKEIILAYNFQLPSTTSNFAHEFVYAGNSFPGVWQDRNGNYMQDTLNLKNAGWQRQEYKWELFESYDDLDVRKRTNFLDYYNVEREGEVPVIDPATGLPKIAAKGICMRKYLGTIDVANVRRFADDYIQYRYADVLLMIAEIKNAQGADPSTEMNAIRERAYRDAKGVVKPYPAFVSSDFATNEMAIYKERLSELIFEGKAWYDLRRMQDGSGKPLAFSAAAAVDGKPVLTAGQELRLYWPIGKTVTTYDPLVVDNQGWPEF